MPAPIDPALERLLPFLIKHLRDGVSLRDLSSTAGVTENTLSRRLRQAHDLKLIAVERAPFQRNRRLERVMRSHFEDLAAAIVVEPVKGSARDTIDALGAATAHEIAASAFGPLGHGRGIGVASGRNVGAVVEGLHSYRNSDESCLGLLRNVSVISLSGCVFTDAEARAFNSGHAAPVTFEADQHAERLAACFISPKLVRLIDPIAQVSETARNARLRVRWEDREFNFAATPPRLAVVGAGLYEEGHRFFDVAIDEKRSADYLKPVRGDLRALAGLSVDLNKHIRPVFPDFAPIADVCNRYFPVEEPHRFRETMNEREEGLGDWLGRIMSGDMKTLIDKLNARLITATKTKLATDVETTLLVATGIRKARVILQLLNTRLGKPRPSPVVNALATTSETAQLVLKLAGADVPSD